MKTCGIVLNVGDPVMYLWHRMIIKKIQLTPNGFTNPELVCVISAEGDNGYLVKATSEKFKPVDDFDYKSIYED